MLNEYTRQRQGRDFSVLNCLRITEKSTEDKSESPQNEVPWSENYNKNGGIMTNNDSKDDVEKTQSLLEQLEKCKAETEYSTVPVDGNEPREMGGISRG